MMQVSATTPAFFLIPSTSIRTRISLRLYEPLHENDRQVTRELIIRTFTIKPPPLVLLSALLLSYV